MNIDLSLNEIEVLLLACEPRGKQDLGSHFKSAKGKLQKARNAMLERFQKTEQQSTLFNGADQLDAAVEGFGLEVR